jgi:hypothetical protein
MLKLPNLPEKEELEYQKQEFFLSILEEFQATSKLWFYFLGAFVLIAIPAGILMKNVWTSSFISQYQPPAVNTVPYQAVPLRVLKTEILPVTDTLDSVYSQIFNPNSDISASDIQYELLLKGSGGNILNTIKGDSYLLAGESKFLLSPTVAANPLLASVELKFGEIHWTKFKPQFVLKLSVLQANTGTAPEGKFFVEGLVRNPEGYRVKKVEVAIVVFDKTNQNIQAINSTVLTDLLPLESRYFRVIWPFGKTYPVAQVQIIPYVNLLDPGFVIQKPDKLPAR